MNSRTLCTFGLATLLVSSAWAQAISPVKANVPFDFKAGKVRLAAGEYRVSTVQPGVIKLTGGHGRSSVMVIGNAAATVVPTTPALVFHRYGSSYFLAEVWGDTVSGIQLPKTAVEKELARQNAKGETRVVAGIR
jgi:hypothetical protein